MKVLVKSLISVLLGFILGTVVFIHGPVGIFRVTSGSMEPVLQVGDFCIVNKVYDYSKLSVGQIVVFSYGAQSKACHRIVEKRDEGFVTKGDANDVPDLFLMTRENFLGCLIIAI